MLQLFFKCDQATFTLLKQWVQTNCERGPSGHISNVSSMCPGVCFKLERITCDEITRCTLKHLNRVLAVMDWRMHLVKCWVPIRRRRATMLWSLHTVVDSEGWTEMRRSGLQSPAVSALTAALESITPVAMTATKILWKKKKLSSTPVVTCCHIIFITSVQWIFTYGELWILLLLRKRTHLIQTGALTWILTS